MMPEELRKVRQVFTETANLPSDNNHDPSNILYFEGRYYLWVTQHMHGKPFEHFRDCKIIRTTSADGINWDDPVDALLPSEDGWDSGGVLTANVTLWQGKYHMFYTGVDREYTYSHFNRYCGIAVADTPNGPFVRYEGNPVIGPSGIGWDEDSADDVTVFEHNGMFRLYYKGSNPGYTSDDTQIGLAVSDSITGPYKRYEGNPINKGHAFAIWKYKHGFLFLSGLKDGAEGRIYGGDWNDPKGTQSLYWSEDGVRFEPCCLLANRAAGIFQGNGQDITTCWGVTVKTKNREFGRYVERFDFVLEP